MTQRTIILRPAALAALLALGLGAAHAQRAARDAAGEQLRAPTAAELKAEARTAARASRAVGIHSGKVDPQPERLANGTVMQELTTDSLMYSVAKRNADGTISRYCVTGEEKAQRLVKAKPSAAPQSFAKASKEQVYEVK